MFDLIATVLAWFYSLVHNYALAIGLLTLSIMVLVTPLTLKSTKSMLELQRVQPEMKKLQAQYKGDRQKLNEEMMKLYQEHKINPLGGCLPMVIQLPVFMILYRVLHGLTNRCTTGMQAAGKCVWKLADGTSRTADLDHFVPSYLRRSTRLFTDLFGQKKMLSFGLDLAEPATKQLANNFVHGLPYLGLVLLVAATSYYQQRQISARMKGQVVNQQQQLLMKIMPAFFALISLTLPAGLIVYFLISNVYRIGQQGYITRKFYKDGPLVVDADDSTTPKGRPDKAIGKSSDAKSSGKPPAAKPAPRGGSGAAPSRPTRPTRPAPGKPSASRPVPRSGKPGAVPPKRDPKQK